MANSFNEYSTLHISYIFLYLLCAFRAFSRRFPYENSLDAAVAKRTVSFKCNLKIAFDSQLVGRYSVLTVFRKVTRLVSISIRRSDKFAIEIPRQNTYPIGRKEDLDVVTPFVLYHGWIFGVIHPVSWAGPRRSSGATLSIHPRRSVYLTCHCVSVYVVARRVANSSIF